MQERNGRKNYDRQFKEEAVKLVTEEAGNRSSPESWDTCESVTHMEAET